ncbi:hypothetical protein [Nocardiopsis sp. FR4]|uniref:hypothetical protein n=1 Tax=Nocardiopsis sp. FR4 TaxID=2605985 RepID=UPI00135BD68E|nr:hypothetical protein [Nocardiopsis sp. FR4]
MFSDELRFAWDQSLLRGNFSRLLLYCEAYLNDGSPSGFVPSIGDVEYSASEGSKGIEIPFVSYPRDLVTIVGRLPEWLPSDSSNVLVPVHPLAGHSDVLESPTLRCVPTASVRTVAVLSPESDVLGFLKLHFPGKIGRFSRDLYHFKWLASLEASAALEQASALAGGIYYLPEDYGWFCEPRLGSSTRGWGTLGRTIGADLLQQPLIPAFSILAKTSRNPTYPLLTELRDRLDWTMDAAFENVIGKLIDSYVLLARDWGLLPECNAQNVLYSIGLNGSTCAPVFRDMGDLFKDMVIRRRRGLSCQFTSYKTIDEDAPDLYERRSFSYDFKLGCYILAPMIAAIATVWSTNQNLLICRSADRFRGKWIDASSYFRSADTWYSYPDVANVSRSSYVENLEPMFR